MVTRSEETSAYSAQEIADAQRELDLHPDFSTFWESRTGQDHLQVIIDLKLQPATTEAQRREWHREAMAAARANDDDIEAHAGRYAR